MVDWPDGVEVPTHLEDARSSRCSLEALRNADKHAQPRERIEVRVEASEDAFELEVMNDGSVGDGRGASLGLRVLRWRRSSTTR